MPETPRPTPPSTPPSTGSTAASPPASRPLPRPDARRARRSLRWSLRLHRLRTCATTTAAVAVLLGVPLVMVDDAAYQRAVQQAGPVVVGTVVEVEQTKGGPYVDVRVGGRGAEVYDLHGLDPQEGRRLRVVVDPDDPHLVVLADARNDPHLALVEGVVAGTAAAALLLAAGLVAGRPPQAAVRTLREALVAGLLTVERGGVVRAEPGPRGLVHGARGDTSVAVEVALEDGRTLSGCWRAADGELRAGRPVLVVGDLAGGWVVLSTTTAGPCWPHIRAS